MSPENIQLVAFFVTGYLVSRLIIKAKLPEHFVHYLIGQKPVTLHRVLLYVIGVSVFLSFLIPNTLTVLTLLPLLTLLKDRILDNSAVDENGKGLVTTMLALAVIYGANIGGMGSITATAANGILIGFATLSEVESTQTLTFASWLVWGIPLVVLFTFAAWVTLVVTFRPRKIIRERIHFDDPAPKKNPFYSWAIGLSISFFASAFLLSLFLNLMPEFGMAIALSTVGLYLVFIGMMFLKRIHRYGGLSPLLRIHDCFSNLPGRGLLFVAIAFALAAILGLSGLHHNLASALTGIFPADLNPFFVLLILALLTSFTTELFSNTVIQLAMFTVILPLAPLAGFHPLLGLLLVTLSCTCAFMSPFATGVNGLAFGEMRGASLSRMIGVGFLMNCVGALLIAAWLLMVVGPYYNLQ